MTYSDAKVSNTIWEFLLGLRQRRVKSKNAKVFFFILKGSRWWLVRSVHVAFSRHLGKAHTKYCPLSSPKKAECFRVCFHCLNGVVILTLNRSYRIRTYTLDAGDHGAIFWSGFGWDDSHPYVLFTPYCTDYNLRNSEQKLALPTPRTD